MLSQFKITSLQNLFAADKINQSAISHFMYMRMTTIDKIKA
jgi:hypothetical protein